MTQKETKLISSKGNIAFATTDAIVNTVNCVGVMGKGVALAIKTEFPEIMEGYKKACDLKTLHPGGLHIYKPEGKNKPFILNVATKNHWRNPSKLEWIETTCNYIANWLQENPKIKSIAIPPLGCGLGGLHWSVVRPIVLGALKDIDVKIHLYE